MQHVLCLVASNGLSRQNFVDTQACLVGADEPVWLSPEIAVEIAFDSGRNAGIEGRIAEALAGAPVDTAILAARKRRRRLLIADMDSTLIPVECVDELAELKGRRAEIAAITERAMRGEIDFEPALRERISLLAGIPQARIERLARDGIALNPGARELVMTMRRHGAHTALVSGGFTTFTSRIARRAGFHEHRANILDFAADGTLSGELVPPVLGREAKLRALHELCAAHGLTPVDVLAIGDGANDLDMLRAAGLGIAYRAKPVVAAAADARIEHGDLTAALYFQGYRRDEIVRD